MEFTSKFTEYLSHGDIASSGSFNTIQLVLVSLMGIILLEGKRKEKERGGGGVGWGSK